MNQAHRIIETPVYYFPELSDEAKETAREWYRGTITEDQDWHVGTIEWLTEVGSYMGFAISDIFFSGFWSQGDGACFIGTYYWPDDEEHPDYRLRKELPQDAELHAISGRLTAVQKKHDWGISASITAGFRGSHENSVVIEVNHTDVIEDDDSDEVGEAARDLMRWMYSKIRSEYEHLTCDEAVDESITANGYEFNEEGERV